MKRFISIFLLPVAFSVSSFASSAVENVDPLAFQKLIDSGEGIVLDVRTPDEVAQGQIGEASVIDFYADDFQRKLGLMNRATPIFVYCRSGGRSGRTAEMMEQMGFEKVYNLSGGIKAWEGKGLPLSKSAIAPAKSAEGMSLGSFKEAIAESDSVLVDFHTNWCVPCRRMRPVIDQLEDDVAGRARVLRVDADASPEVASAFNVVGVPVFVIIKGGQEIARLNGIVSLEKLKETLLEGS